MQAMMNTPSSQIPRPGEVIFSVPATKVDDQEVPETQVNVTVFSNRILAIITQMDKMGTMISGELENPEADSFTEKSFEIKTIFGSCDRQSYEIYCRSLLELMNSLELIVAKTEDSEFKFPRGYRSPFANKMLLLSISLKKFSSEDVERKVFKNIFEAFKVNLRRLL